MNTKEIWLSNEITSKVSNLEELSSWPKDSLEGALAMDKVINEGMIKDGIMEQVMSPAYHDFVIATIAQEEKMGDEQMLALAEDPDMIWNYIQPGADYACIVTGETNDANIKSGRVINVNFKPIIRNMAASVLLLSTLSLYSCDTDNDPKPGGEVVVSVDQKIGEPYNVVIKWSDAQLPLPNGEILDLSNVASLSVQDYKSGKKIVEAKFDGASLKTILWNALIKLKQAYPDWKNLSIGLLFNETDKSSVNWMKERLSRLYFGDNTNDLGSALDISKIPDGNVSWNDLLVIYGSPTRSSTVTLTDDTKVIFKVSAYINSTNANINKYVSWSDVYLP